MRQIDGRGCTGHHAVRTRGHPHPARFGRRLPGPPAADRGPAGRAVYPRPVAGFRHHAGHRGRRHAAGDELRRAGRRDDRRGAGEGRLCHGQRHGARQRRGGASRRAPRRRPDGRGARRRPGCVLSAAEPRPHGRYPALRRGHQRISARDRAGRPQLQEPQPHHQRPVRRDGHRRGRKRALGRAHHRASRARPEPRRLCGPRCDGRAAVQRVQRPHRAVRGRPAERPEGARARVCEPAARRRGRISCLYPPARRADGAEAAHRARTAHACKTGSRAGNGGSGAGKAGVCHAGGTG